MGSSYLSHRYCTYTKVDEDLGGYFMQNTQTHHSPAPNLWHSVFSAWISIKEQKKLITPVLTSHSHLERHDRSKNMRLLSGWGRGSQARSVKRRLSSSSCLFLVFIIAHLTESQKLPFGISLSISWHHHLLWLKPSITIVPQFSILMFIWKGGGKGGKYQWLRRWATTEQVIYGRGRGVRELLGWRFRCTGCEIGGGGQRLAVLIPPTLLRPVAIPKTLTFNSK